MINFARILVLKTFPFHLLETSSMGSGEYVLEVQSATCIVHVGRVGEVPGENNHEDDDEGEYEDDEDEDDDEYEDYEDYADQENILEKNS